MALERIEEFYNLPNIQAQFDAVNSGLNGNMKTFVALYDTINKFKDTTISNLVENTEKLNAAVNGSVQATARAKQAYDDLTNRISAQVRASADNVTATNQNTQAYDQLVKQAVRNKIALDDLSASQAQLKKALQAGTSTLQEYETSMADITSAQLRLKTSNADVTKTLSNLQKQALSADGSLDQMRATLNLLTQQYDKLNAAEKQSEGGQGLLKTIQDLDKATKDQETSTGRSQRKVGDYTGALSVLEEQLVAVNAQLAKMKQAQSSGGVQNLSAASPVGFDVNKNKPGGTSNFTVGFDANKYKELQQQADALTVVLGRQGKGFQSTTMQIRASEQALQTLRAAGLEGSEGFEKLRASTVEANQAQKEFQRQEKLLESEAPVLGAITLAAKGLAGAYAVGAGSVALFAEGNEKVEKELNKLVAIMTILQGLQEAYELINKSGASIVAIRTALTKLSNAVLVENAASTQVVADANLAAATAAEAATAAVGEEAIALQAEAVAAAEAAIATEAAAVSAEAFSTALVATGIGAAIAVIAVAVSYLITKMREWQLGTGLTIKEQEALAEATKKVNDALAEQVRMADEADQGLKKFYENQLGLSQAAGQNEYKQTAIRKALIAEEKNLAQARINQLGASYSSVSALGNQISDLENKIKTAADIEKGLSDIPEIRQTVVDRIVNPGGGDAIAEQNERREQQIKAAQANQEFYKKQLESIKGVRDAQKSALDDHAAAVQKDGQEEYKMSKFTADEIRRLTLETAKIQIEAIKNKNSIILGDEKSTLDQRLAAIRSNAQQEARSAKAEFNSLDPQSTPAQQEEARRKMQATIALSRSAAHQAQLAEEQKFYQRQRDATFETAKLLLQDQIDKNNALLASDKSTQDQRLLAIADNFNKQKAIAGAELLQALDNPALKALDIAGKQNPERIAAIEKYNNSVMGLQIKFGQDQEAEQKREQDRQQKLLEESLKQQKDTITISHADQVKALNNKNNSTAFGSFGYDKKKKDADDKARQDDLRAQIDADERALNQTKVGSQARHDAEAKISQDSLDLNQLITDKTISKQEKLKEAVVKAAEETTALVQASIDARYTNELNHIQKLIDANERAKASEIDRITSSTKSEQEKAAAIAIINAQTDAQNQALAIKARKLKHEQAVADKAFNVAQAIEQGVLATLSALDKGGPVLAAVVGGIAALEVANIIATPIPAYAEGTMDHPGGLAYHSEAGYKEFILEPGKPGRWSSGIPTIESLKPHTIVAPPHKINEMLMSGMFVNQQGALISSAEDNNKKELRELKEAVIWNAQEIKGAIKNNRQRTVNNIRVDTNWGSYLNKSVFDRK